MKKVIGSLQGVDGNAFALMAHFRELARKQKFSAEWIDSVLKQAMSGDYDHLIRTLMENMEGEDE